MDRFDELLFSTARECYPSLPKDALWASLLRARHEQSKSKSKKRARILHLCAGIAACLILCAGSFFAGQKWALTPVEPQVSGYPPVMVDVPQTDGENEIEVFEEALTFADLPNTNDIESLSLTWLPDGATCALEDSAWMVRIGAEDCYSLFLSSIDDFPNPEDRLLLRSLVPGRGLLRVRRGEESGALTGLSLALRLTEESFLMVYQNGKPDKEALLSLAEGIRAQ